MKRIINIVLIISFCVASNAYAASHRDEIQLYHPNVHLSPVHKKKLEEDISRYHQAANIWDVLRDEFSLPHYEDNPQVKDRIEWFLNNQDYLLRSATRAAPYLYYILNQVRKKHLPAEIVLLPIIESGYNPFSLSNMGAAGLWQLMPGTASGFGIIQNSWYDGRRDIIASTRAALNYLSYLQSFFEGNWLRAIAAYNTGEGNVLAAIKRNIREGRRTDFWSLPVAQQTRDYVPSLLALAIIISHPDRYPIYFPPVQNAPYLAQIDVGRQINLKYAANLAGLSFKKLMELNPGFSHSSNTKGPYKLILPIENVEQFSENLARAPVHTQVKWFHYKVKASDTLATVAKKFNSTISNLKQLNRLATNTLKPGLNLLIPNNPEANANVESIMELFAANKTKVAREHSTRKALKQIKLQMASRRQKSMPKNNYHLQPGDTIYMVRQTDTVASISKKFNIQPNKLLAINRIKTQDIKAGKQIIIPTHANLQLASAATTTKLNKQFYVVKRGDTIAKIAHKFNTSPASIRIANLVDDNSLHEGEKLVVPVTFRS